MKSEIIENLLKEGKTGFMILSPRKEFDPGVVGYKQEENKLVYDYSLLFASLCKHWRATFKTEDELMDAVDDHLSYNTLRFLSYYSDSPIILLEDENGNKVPYGEE